MEMSVSGGVRPNFDAILPARDDLRPLHICWFLHNHCNHRCSYCHESNWSGSFRWVDFAQVQAFVEQVKAHYGDRQILVSFTGGEPTLWPDFEKCVQYLTDSGIEIGMTSNGAKPIEFFERIAEKFSWISLSFHPEFTRPDKFLSLVNYLSGVVPISVRIMLPTEEKLWRRSMEFRENLERSFSENRIRGRVQIEMVKTVSGFGTVNTAPIVYAAEQEAELLKFPSRELSREGSIKPPYASVLGEYVTHQNGDATSAMLRVNDLVESHQVNFQNWICNIGLEQLFVGADGFVFRSGCGVGSRLGRLGHRISFPTKPVRCWKSYCHCATDIAVSKISPEWVKNPSRDSSFANRELLSGASTYERLLFKFYDSLQREIFELETSQRDRSLRGRVRGIYLLLKRFWLTLQWSSRWSS